MTTQLTIAAAGANHGGLGTLPYLAALSQDAERAEMNVLNVDPVPGRAHRLAARGQAQGIRALGREDNIETVIPELADDSLVLLNIDRPDAVATSLELLADRSVGVLGYGFLKAPDHRLFGFRFQYGAEEYESKRAGASCFRGIDRFTGRGGRDRIFGDRGQPEHLDLEPLFREWFGRHLNENITKYAAGLPSNNSNMELTTDGQRTLPVFVQQSQHDWADPYTLTSLVLFDPPEPVLRGDEFCVAEVQTEGVRLHFARLRKTDGRLSVDGFAGFDPQTLANLEAAERARVEAAERERLQRELTTALQQAERKTVTRRAPFFMTD
jgi:hypothetical protein